LINQNFWGCACTLCTPATYTTVKNNVSWKRTFHLVVTVVALHHKHMKPFKPFTPHDFAWSVTKGFNQPNRRTKDQQTRLHFAVFSLSDAEICNAIRSYEKRKDREVLAKTESLLSSKTVKQQR